MRLLVETWQQAKVVAAMVVCVK